MRDEAALDPENRALYAEILRAPGGFDLDAAVATTYTLDFETALVVPATLAFHAAENRQETLDTPGSRCSRGWNGSRNALPSSARPGGSRLCRRGQTG